MKKRILVTGSNGLLGQKITDTFLTDGSMLENFELIATAIGPNRHPSRTGYQYVELDISSPAEVRKTIEAVRPDCIIHTAAMTNVDACEENPEACWQLNVEAVRSLAAQCVAQSIHLVHLSTDFIFDGHHPPYREDATPNPLSFYGKSKLESENVISESGCAAAILRTVLVYGVVSDMTRSNIVLWAKNALKKNERIRVVDDQWRMPTLAEDLATACLFAARLRAEGTYHVAGPALLSILEIVQEIAAFWDLDQTLITPVGSETLNQKAPRPINTAFILDKATHALNYRPRTFREGLAVVDQQLRDADSM